MKIPPQYREPEPSETLKKYGNVVADSFYYVQEGKLKLPNKPDQDCSFEVAHMQDGHSFVVVYVQQTEDINSFHNDLFEATSLGSSILIGQDEFWDVKLQVQLKRLLFRSSSSMFGPSGHRIVYHVSKYEAFGDTDEQNTLYAFYIRNLVLDGRYSSKAYEKDVTRSLYEHKKEKALDVALDVMIANYDSELSTDDLRNIVFEEVEKIDKPGYERSSKNWQNPKQKVIEVKVNDNVIAKIITLKDYEDKEYDTEPLAFMRIYKDKYPSSWSEIESADWICYLLSLALGRVISWNYYHQTSSSQSQHIYLLPYRVWRTLNIETNKFFAFTEEYGHFRMDKTFGLTGETNALNLVTDVLEYIFTLNENEREKYLEVLSYYVVHASTNTVMESTFAMFCLLGERICRIWEDIAQPDNPDRMTDQDRRKFMKSSKRTLTRAYKFIEPKQLNETKKDYNQRIGKLVSEIQKPIGDNLNHISLTTRYIRLFREYNWYISDKNKQLNSFHDFRYRIEYFVESRNKLAHDHRFVTKQNSSNFEEEFAMEIINIQMFIPQLLATVLGYRGSFWRRVSSNYSGWDHMPH